MRRRDPCPSWADGPFDVEGSQVLERLIRVVDGLPRLADSVNGATFPSIQPIVVREGDIVAVTIINRGTETHPMHIHGHHVLVLSRNGVEVDGALWLDTVDVKPGRDAGASPSSPTTPGCGWTIATTSSTPQNGMVMHLAYEGVTSPFELGGEHAQRSGVSSSRHALAQPSLERLPISRSVSRARMASSTIADEAAGPSRPPLLESMSSTPSPRVEWISSAATRNTQDCAERQPERVHDPG